jgi:outer membrane protein assembly factor BamB
MLRIKTIALLLLLYSVQAETNAEQWPQFRGPNATGLSLESKNLPVEFSYQDKVLWSANLGEGIACPVVSQGKVCATAMTSNKKFAVVCFDASTGQELWRR